MNALRYVKLAMLAVGCVFGLAIGVRDLRVALAEDAPTEFEAETFAERYDEQSWIAVRGRVDVEHRSVRPSDNRAHAGKELAYITAPVVGPDWAPSQPVHVLVAFGPFTPEQVEAWPREVGSVEVVRGEIRPIPLADAPELFADVELGTPLVVINEGTAPDLAASIVFSGLMLGFGALAGYLLVVGVRERISRPAPAGG